MSEHAKIQIHGEGIGEVDEALLHQRATEIAKTDGRSNVNSADLAHAREELVNGYPTPQAPETSPQTEQMTEWDERPAEHGVQAVRVLPEDDGNIVEELVLEGNEEADHDSRVQSQIREEED